MWPYIIYFLGFYSGKVPYLYNLKFFSIPVRDLFSFIHTYIKRLGVIRGTLVKLIFNIIFIFGTMIVRTAVTTT